MRYLRGDGEVGGARGVLGLEVVGAFAGSNFDEAKGARVFAGGLDDGDGDLRALHPAFEQDLGVVPERFVDGVEQAVGFFYA